MKSSYRTETHNETEKNYHYNYNNSSLNFPGPKRPWQ